MASMLEGIRVVSFTHFLQGPSACQLLADLGADVIKIEPAGGAFERSWTGPGRFLDGYSPFFALANRNVRSIVADLKRPEALEVVRRLIEGADVLVESFRPGTMERLGLGYEELSARNPRLVYTSLSGYGSDGPYKDMPGQDVLVQALSGLAAATGRADQPPTPVGACVVDQHAAVLGAFGILAALHGRERTGVGTKVESNLLNAALDLQIEPLAYRLNGFEPQRSSTGVSSPFYTAPYGVFATSDGYLCISLTSPDRLAAVLEDDWFTQIGPDEAYDRRDELNARVADHLRGRSSGDWSQHFAASKMWFAPVQDYDQVLADPQVLHNDSIDSFHDERAGEVRVLKHPVRYGGVRPGVRTPPPGLGEHTEAVLAELGYDADTIAELQEQGAMA
ncbi:CaiB/BaiF CoA transferase family protein [Pseudactinotalea suaedae]|uniref:CaiB/BaiF CoA transferase family protein n=1 Tax=Pseudactinotalea suaedae TaxID=1524924 RepID=UPI001F4FB1D7|nr:CoA transferase [Pseudactinotalea suaedae]